MEKRVAKERILKRVFDVAVSALLLLALSPLFVLFAVLLKIEGLFNPFLKGPVFYKETRVSRGRPFTLYKFRTVNADTLKVLSEASGKKSITQFICAENNHEFLTPVGALIDKIYFDELPQLFNVLKGDMSLVGPRPHILPQYKKDLECNMVSSKYIKGGIMGLVQAAKINPQLQKAFARMALKHSGEDHRLALIDKLYLHKYLNASAFEMLSFDIYIMYKCLLVILHAKGI